MRMTVGSDTLDFSYDANGVPLTMTYNGTVYYYITNLQGDVISLERADGGSGAQYAYDAWGNILAMSGTLAELNPLRYRGYVYDQETGFYYLNSRYYDPAVGRFINADNQLTMNNLSGVNLFAYCGNDPANRNDPTGEAWYHWALGAAVVAATAVATVVTCGGFAAAATAVCLVGNGVAAATTAATISAGAFIGSATVLGVAALSAAANSSSVKDFCDQGNWGTVTATVGGGAFGAGYGYSKSSTASKPVSQPKVISTIENDIIDLPRTGSALKTDAHHAFSNIVDNYAGYATKSDINNGTLYQLLGSLNGKDGRFEWIVQNEQVTHRMFVEGGGINGIPIMP